MLLQIFLLVFLPSCFGLEDISQKFSLEYFIKRDVKFVCLLTCDNPSWSLNFAKDASKHSVAVVNVKIYSAIDFNKVDNCLQQHLHAVGVLIDIECSKFNEVIYHVSNQRFFNSMRKWLLVHENLNDSWVSEKYENVNDTRLEFDENHKLDRLVSVLDQLNISIDADIILSIKEDATTFYLYDVFNFGKDQGGSININKIGSWNNNTGLEGNFDTYKYYRRWDFQQISMRQIIVTSEPPKKFDPKMILGRERYPGVAQVTKTSASALQVIAEIHNFRYNYTITDRWIGDFKENGSTASVATSLYRREQDISPVIRFIPITQEKIGLLHPPLTSIETRFYYRIPTYGAGKYENQFLRPLATGAWYCVIAVITLCALALLLSAKLERRTSPTQYAVFSVAASFCQQFFEDSGSVESNSVSTAGKLTVSITGLSCVLIYNYYTSSVVSWLLNGPPPSITSLEELLESPLELIFEDVGYTRSWLQDPNYYFNKRNAKIEDEMRKKKVFNKKANAPLYMSQEKGIEMVQAGGYAYHTEVDSANLLISRKFTQSELCELGSLQTMETTLLYPPIQKNSPYKEFFIWNLARLSERGITSCIQHRTSSAPVECEGSSPRALALGGAAPAFLLLAAGYILATAIMLLERFYALHFKR